MKPIVHGIAGSVAMLTLLGMSFRDGMRLAGKMRLKTQ